MIYINPVIVKIFFLFFLFGVIHIKSLSQNIVTEDLLGSLLKIENNEESYAEKLAGGKKLLSEANRHNAPRDSVYARLLHKIAVWIYYAENDLVAAINYTRESIKINLSGRKDCSSVFAIGSYNNLGIFFSDNYLNHEALHAFDTVILLSKNNANDNPVLKSLRILRAQIFFRLVNYQQSINETTLGIQEGDIYHDSLMLGRLYIERAIAEVNFNLIERARSDIDVSYQLLINSAASADIMADLFKTKALVMEKWDLKDSAFIYYIKALKERIRFGDSSAIAEEYSDVGIFCKRSLKKFKEALTYHYKALKIAEKIQHKVIKANVFCNIADVLISQNNYSGAINNCQSGLSTLCDIPFFPFNNPDTTKIKECSNPFSLFALFNNKVEALLGLFDSSDPATIKIAVSTCFLADIVVDLLRNQQPSVSSKLFWSDKARNFYRLAIEASFLANDPAGVLYFMEKSRAVLLNDKLNEIGSLAKLPAAEAEQEQQLRITIASLEKQKEGLSGSDTDYRRISSDLLQAKDRFSAFIKDIETRFPVYYQYKYNSKVPGISEIKDKLLPRGGSYLSYFEADSVVYALHITRNDVQLKKFSFPGYADSVKLFLELCRNRQKLNTNFDQYRRLAHQLYQQLVAPLHIPGGKVILSPDLSWIPFDALLKDAAGKEYLLYDHSFDYTYSAGYLIRLLAGAGRYESGFLGIAPEHFDKKLSLNDLLGSVQSIEHIAAAYPIAQLARYKAATRHYFLTEGGRYGLLHIYAHARADKEAEPVLYMNDSAIAISELQRWGRPAVDLAFLAACETGAGALYPGEGINSIARSFAAVGVPSTIATLWKADDKAVYAISEQFHAFLNRGLPKDEALRKAKIAFMQNDAKENELPFYWASVVLSGDPRPVAVAPRVSPFRYWMIAGIFVLAGLLGWYYYNRKRARTGS